MFTKLIVSGRVQGVGFRYFVYNLAKSYNALGYVKNLNNGEVEILIDSVTANNESFKKALKQGPTLSRVDNIEQSAINVVKKYENFNVK